MKQPLSVRATIAPLMIPMTLVAEAMSNKDPVSACAKALLKCENYPACDGMHAAECLLIAMGRSPEEAGSIVQHWALEQWAEDFGG